MLMDEQAVEIENSEVQASRLNAIIASMSKIYWVIYDLDLVSGTYEKVSANKKSLELTGDKGKIEDSFAALLQSFVHEQSREAMEQFGDLSTIDERMRDKTTLAQEYCAQNGHWYEARFVEKERDENGRLLQLLYVVSNIDARKKTEKENESQREEQLAIFDALARNYLNVYLINRKDGTVKILKLEGYVTTGFKENGSKPFPYEMAYRQYVSERVYPDDREMMYKALSLESIVEALSHDDEYVGNYRTIKGDETHYYQFKYTTLATSPDYIIAGFQNIDNIVEEQQKQQQALTTALAAAEQSNRAKTTFLSNMSHDIRTPMNAIIGFTALAQAHIDNTELVQDYLSKITTSSSHLLSLINDILDMSRIESGSVKLEEEVVHMPDILHDLRTIINGQVAAKQQNLYIDTQDMVHEDVVADKLRLNQVLLNIVSNAIKFTPAGGNIIIRVTEKPCQNSNRTSYEFRIKDTGIGMSKEFQEHVFETFSREQTSTVSGIQGTGLGMAITKNIVDMMGGTITVHSEEGVGTEFVVVLDFLLADCTVKYEPVDKHDEKPTARADYSGRRVLLVEDNELNREIATAILEDVGFTVDKAADGTDAVEAINRADENTYDLVLMDVQMPKMDGYTATREIRTLGNNRKANVPIVAMTANAFEEDRQKAFESGMNEHVAKPINIDKLLETVDAIFEAEKSRK